jgi:hypothetical protein
MRRSSAIACAVALAACGAPSVQTVDVASAACASGARYAEVADGGTIVRVLGIRSSRSGLHEGLLVRFAHQTDRIEDNVDITGPIPAHPGDRVTLQGQFECDDRVIHWTHHDPGGHHTAGFIEVDGRRYQ